MNRRSLAIRVVCAIAMLSAVSGRALAQPEPTGGPFAGLFRGSPQNQPQVLDVSGSAFGSWDDNPFAAAPNGNAGFGAPQGVKPGIADGLQASLRYAFQANGTRSQLSLFGTGSLQEFGTSLSKNLLFQSYNLGGAITTKLTNKVSMSFAGSAAYSPYFQYAPFLTNTASAESPVGTDTGYAVNSDWVRTNSAVASIDDHFSKRSGMSGTINWTQQDLTSENLTIDTLMASGRFTHNLTRKLTFHVGYGVQEVSYDTAGVRTAPFRSAFMDIGLGYGDGLVLHFARYYTLTLNAGATVVRNGDPAFVVKSGKETALAATGNATLSRSIGRKWEASLAYIRGTSYVVGFLQPLTTDSANAGLGGSITPRLFFSAGAGASRGQQVFTQNGTLVAYTGSTRLTYGLLKNLGLFAQASYYKYSIPNAFEIFGFAPLLERRSVSVGVNAWLPLLKPPRVRRTPDEPPTGLQ